MKSACALIAALVLCSVSHAVDLVVLTNDNWTQYAPPGKEADAILGDYVLKNDLIWAVVAQPAKWRHANMTCKNVGACLIDFTTVAHPNDQLTALFTTMRRSYERAETSAPNAPKAVLTFHAVAENGQPDVTLSYELEDGQTGLTIRTIFHNGTDAPLEVTLADNFRADDFPAPKAVESDSVFCLADDGFDEAYAIAADGHTIGKNAQVAKAMGRISYAPAGTHDPIAKLKPGEKYELVRHVYPADHQVGAVGEAARARGVAGAMATLRVVEEADGKKEPVEGIEIFFSQDGKMYGYGRTGLDGTLKAFLQAGKYELSCKGPGYGTQKIDAPIAIENAKAFDQSLTLPRAAKIVAEIKDETGGPIPCKVQFKAINGTAEPVFGPRTGSTAVMNLRYTHDGKFTQKIDPGEYEAIVSYGPEYDVVRVPLKIAAGAVVPLTATLKRAFKTPGWVSTDYHSHSSPSGDNTCDQRGRVLNLLCEQIEFAPCTEHNRIDSYEPHLKALGVEKLMGTCIGMELTGSPLPLNHQNAFPMAIHPRTQDNGAPQPDKDPQIQIRRLAEWDNASEKFVQQNHPDIGWLFYDKDGDGVPDGGYADGFKFMNGMEVHPIDKILDMKPTHKLMLLTENTRTFNWLQLLNQGFRIWGVVNTDAHQAFHGSGGLRNYVRCDADYPGAIDKMAIVRSANKGHSVMSTAPFMTVTLNAAIPGDEIKLPGGKGELSVSVQCANWYDIDRVQVLINGRPDPSLNFTRKSHPEAFGTDAVRFQRKIPIELKHDAHVIVVAVGSTALGEVVGPNWGEQLPCAVSNPIFADVDGESFKPNKDTLDAPLPVKHGAAN